MRADDLRVRDFFNITNAYRSWADHQPSGLLRPAVYEPGHGALVGEERQGIQVPVTSIRHDQRLWPAWPRQERDLLPLKEQ